MENKNYLYDAVALLKELIAIPSVSRDETRAADKLADFLNMWNLPFGPTVMLNAHIDTVKPVSSWTRDPFSPDQEYDVIYGLGSNDCGGGLVSLLQAYRIMLYRPRNYNLLWVASAEEEISGQNGLTRVLPLLPKIDVAIVGEPTGMQPAIAEKGLMVIDGYAHGKSGHAARNEGINAIYEALDDLVWLRDYKFRKVSPLLGPTKMTVTVVEGGTQHNVVPDTLHFVIDVRTNEFYQHPLIKRCIDRGMQPFGSPTLSDQALMPFPSFKLGPGESSRSHSANEFIKISEMEQAIDTYVALLEGLDLLG